MNWFWWLIFASFGIISVGTLNPVPILIPLVMWILTRPIENNLRAQVEAGGLNPDLPPLPTNPTRACSCVLWLIVFCGVALFFVAAVMLLVSGELQPGMR